MMNNPVCLSVYYFSTFAVADPRGRPRRPPRTKIFLISCSFSENLSNLYAGAPSWRVGALPMGNPGSAPDLI